MRVLVGSNKEMKISAVQQVLVELRRAKHLDEDCTVDGREVSSKVSSSPEDIEILKGAQIRAQSLYELFKTEADLFVGIESGLTKRNGILFEEAWCAVIDENGHEYIGISSALPVPKYITDQMDNGEKHTEILDKIWEEHKINTKDTWIVYSKGMLLRKTGLKESFRNAVVQYLAVNKK